LSIGPYVASSAFNACLFANGRPIVGEVDASPFESVLNLEHCGEVSFHHAFVLLTTHADPLYQHLIVTAERKFWRCVESGEPPRLFGVEPPKPRIEAVRIVDMSGSNSWAEFAGLFRDTQQAFLEHERSKVELKSLMPEDAKEAIGHGVRAKRSKSGAVSFDLLEVEGSHAALQ